MSNLVVNIEGTKHLLSSGPAKALRTDGRRLFVDQFDPAGDQLGYFVSGISGWFFRTEDLSAVRDMRIGGNAITELSTPLRGNPVEIRLDRPKYIHVDPTSSLVTPRNLLWPRVLYALAGCGSAIVLNLMTNLLPQSWAWTHSWLALGTMLVVFTGLGIVLPARFRAD